MSGSSSGTGVPDDAVLPPERRATSSGLALRDSGPPPGRPDGPPLVLLHGLTSTADLTWFSVSAGLATRHRVLAIDLPAHGSTPAMTRFDLDDVADTVARFVTDELDGPAVLVGFSMGGVIAPLVWRRHPEVVAGLVLCSTAADFRPEQLLQRRVVEPLRRAVLAVARRMPPRVRARTAHRLQASTLARMGAGAETSDLHRWAHDQVWRGDPWGVADAGGALRRHDGRAWIGDVDVPCAVVVTTRDAVVPPERQRQLAEVVRAVRVVELDGDHDMFIDRSSEWADGVVQAVGAVVAAIAAAGSKPPSTLNAEGPSS